MATVNLIIGITQSLYRILILVTLSVCWVRALLHKPINFEAVVIGTMLLIVIDLAEIKYDAQK